jgi:osmotically-inducible protein OsmY
MSKASKIVGPIAISAIGRSFLICLMAVALVSVQVACTPKKDRRSFGTVIDDQAAETRIVDALYSRPEFDEADHIKAEVHNGTLLLAGETKSEANKALATRIASEFKTVDLVVNELAVMPAADTGGRLHNSYITSKVNSRLAFANPVEGFDPGRIKVITAHGTVYLMGTVSRGEGAAVAEVVRNVGGVDKVVKVFDYTD